MATQEEIAQQLVLQLRVLDPNASAEIGTPERKILDTFAQALAENEIDINQISGTLDLDSKVGSDLDNFLAIFRFGRQQGSQANGFVTFSRVTTANYTISIPANTLVMAPSISTNGFAQNMTFTTTEYAEITPGSLSAIAPVRCTQTGTIGNLAIDQITSFSSAPILGITSITNEIPTTGGVDPESDDELKVRFRNTVFRNLAGTQDAFLALAVATQFTTKANVVGPISRYREYIQVPDVDDASNDPDSGIGGNGNAGEWTTALSTIPYSKHVYGNVPYYVTDGKVPNTTFYRQGVDFRLNIGPLLRNRGDTYRIDITGDSVNDHTKPNLTFLNVITDPAVPAKVQGIRPGDVLYYEHSYMSTASRNDSDTQVNNCVDVYVNGTNLRPADSVIPKPRTWARIFNSDPTDVFYWENYRRVGEPHHRPVQGNLLAPVFWQPTMDLPAKIVTSDATYLKGIHYWPVIDTSLDTGRSTRAHNGIEWNPNIPGKLGANPAAGPFTGPKVTATADTHLTVPGYFYDRNIIDLQTALDGNKQITTDVLAHQATTRYFKVDITVMYTNGFTAADVNAQISNALLTYFQNQYFGAAIQLSDILQIIHSVTGVDNVRWSKELLIGSTDEQGSPRTRVVECDINGNPLNTLVIDRKIPGDAGTAAVYIMYASQPLAGGLYKLKYDTTTTDDIIWHANAIPDEVAIDDALTTASIPAQITAGSGIPADPWIVTFTTNGYRASLIEVTDNRLLDESDRYNADFLLNDDELPTIPVGKLSTDSAPGVTVRKRAQSTWNVL